MNTDKITIGELERKGIMSAKTKQLLVGIYQEQQPRQENNFIDKNMFIISNIVNALILVAAMITIVLIK